MLPRYPNIVVKLVGEDGNALAVVGRVREALRRAGVPREEVSLFTEEATSGDYNHLLQTVLRWVSEDTGEGAEMEDDE